MDTLLIGELHLEAEELLAEHTNLKMVGNEQFSNGEGVFDTEAVVLRTFTKLGKEELRRLPNLKFVVSCSVGLNNLDLGELEKRGIKLIHCPGSNANSVAEHTLYLLLSLFRGGERPFPELKSKSVGIVGFGFIGKLVAKKLLGLGVKVVAFDVIEQEEAVLKELQVEMKDFDSVLRSDIVTVHVPLNKHTTKLIGGDAFSKMKEGVFFINTSREEVVDEEALLRHYNRGKFDGVGLDVYSSELKEKLVEGNIMLTDHVGAQGEDSFRNMCLLPVEIFLKEIKTI
ncbi:hypothetical protein GOV03_03240 [Candidatus Woesearchaeota archaeon]|nr:hypothetical protein [Candidatus Woesearchaeota archaeon]